MIQKGSKRQGNHVCSFEGTVFQKLWLEIVTFLYNIGDWSNGMIGVSKTFGGSSILSSPVSLSVGSLDFTGFPALFVLLDFLTMSAVPAGIGGVYNEIRK